MKKSPKHTRRIPLFLLIYLLSMPLTAAEPTAHKPIEPPQSMVHGKVTDTEGQPLAGVNITVESSNQGTISELDGSFTVQAAPDDVLLFTMVGLKPLTMPIAGRDVIILQMEEEVTQLGEVVLNAGYYTVSERERTGSIEKLTSADIEKQPISNPLAPLQGRMPGVYVQQSTGLPGGDFKIRIRGTNSLRPNGNEPLYIIDGVPFPSTAITDSRVGSASVTSSPLNNINPMDIASMEILKDADATAIYGSRGANGVVLITTKKGNTGKLKFNVHLQTGTARIAHNMDLLNTEQYLQMREEAFANDNAVPTPANAPDLTVWDRDRHTDWQDELLGGTAHMNNVQLSASGGNAQTTFRLAGGFRNETTILPASFGVKKINGSLNLNHRSLDGRFNATVTANFVHDQSDMLSGLLLFPALKLAPNAPEPYDENGDLNWADNTWSNPLAELEKKYKSSTANLITNAHIAYRPLPGLELSSALGYNTLSARESQYTPHASIRPSYRAFTPRSANRNTSAVDTWIWEPQITYETALGKFRLTTMAGATLQKTTAQRYVVNAKGFNSDALMENFQAATTLQIYEDSETEYKYQAIFARANLSIDGTYFFNLTGRRDGSSRFGPGRQYGNFGALGAAWIFTNERIFGNGTVLSFGKLRGSYGTTGNDQIGNYQYLNLWSPVSQPYQNISGLAPSRLYNPNFGWETNTKLEAALDLGFFNDRLMLSAGYFQNRSSDQLVGLPLPGTTGFTTVQSNLPATVENTGWEFQLTTKNVETDNFQWNTSMNLSILRNRLLEYPDLENSPYASTYVVGEPLSVQSGYRYTGVHPTTGVYEFEDVNGDGFLSFPDDVQVLGDLSVDFFGGVQNTFQWGGLGLEFLVQGAKQMGTSAAFTFDPPGFLSNQPIEVLDRWQEPGDVANVQRYASTYNAAAFTYYDLLVSDYPLVDASFLRLRNVSLSYDIPLPSRAKIGVRCYLQGQNLVTITNYKGLDPENPGANQIPNLKQYTLGLQLNF
ncbi:hypothetical protein DN53_05525 [Flagellimonas olearia]|uniref:SusC/RagA family TonB-linked outer membrane protein n=2 Tax=Flagellimonas olearia TaxID=552546 RepID=A0A444VI13_9FLAO|nr:hypothetical protein DN53_05525 [Allomuricauda olearia]